MPLPGNIHCFHLQVELKVRKQGEGREEILRKHRKRMLTTTRRLLTTYRVSFETIGRRNSSFVNSSSFHSLELQPKSMRGFEMIAGGEGGRDIRWFSSTTCRWNGSNVPYGESVMVDLKTIPVGEMKMVKWKRNPYFVVHRTKEEIEEAMQTTSKMIHYERDEDRVKVTAHNHSFINPHSSCSLTQSPSLT
jgi:hypothetical protein